jgi:UDP:flavonoid glycosyltransferase YjiC (YdhE family)
VRRTDDSFTLPEPLAHGTGALIYFSLGSLGSADVGLMRRVIGYLADTPHRYVVSKGPLHAEIALPPNMYGAEFLPQTSVIPLADLVITHGGNNTTTECLHFGKPMIVLPLFWDQYDNAQRVDELGLGARLDTYGCTRDELRAAVERLLGDGALRVRLAAAAEQIQRATPKGQHPRNLSGTRTGRDRQLWSRAQGSQAESGQLRPGNRGGAGRPPSPVGDPTPGACSELRAPAHRPR